MLNFIKGLLTGNDNYEEEDLSKYEDYDLSVFDREILKNFEFDEDNEYIEIVDENNQIFITILLDNNEDIVHRRVDEAERLMRDKPFLNWLHNDISEIYELYKAWKKDFGELIIDNVYEYEKIFVGVSIFIEYDDLIEISIIENGAINTIELHELYSVDYVIDSKGKVGKFIYNPPFDDYEEAKTLRKELYSNRNS